MECLKCGHTIGDQDTFCPYCGQKVMDSQPESGKPIYIADIKRLLASVKMAVYHDRVELITSDVQKTIFNYSGLVSVKKGPDRILFISENGHTESCILNKEIIHDAFMYIEKAARPYIDERTRFLFSKGIKCLFVSAPGLNSGMLYILNDRADFKAKFGRSETIYFKDTKSVALSKGKLEFTLTDKKTKSFTFTKNIREEVLSFTEKTIQHYIEERKEALLSRGIYYSFPSSQGTNSGILDIFKDKIEFTDSYDQRDIILFRHVRIVCQRKKTLEFSLTNGTSRSFTVDADIQEEVFSFVEQAIQPYVTERTFGFEINFGVDEQIEINETRGVFHIVRQGGNEITDEYSLHDIEKCQQIEYNGPDNAMEDFLCKGMAIFNSAADAVGILNTANGSEKLSYTGISLTIRTEQGVHTENIRFGILFWGINPNNKKYNRCVSQISKFMGYLNSRYPECQLIAPKEPLSSAEKCEDSMAADPAAKEDLLGVIKYIESLSGFISECETPMTIAMQGSWESGKNSIMQMLSINLNECYGETPIWFDARQLSQISSKDRLPILVGDKLISQLGGTNKNRMIKVVMGSINIISGVLSNGSIDGRNLTEALFNEHSTSSLEKLVKDFQYLVQKKTDDKKGKVIIFVDGVYTLEPSDSIKLIETIKNNFSCEGCVYVFTIDYSLIISGIKEKYGQNLDENNAKTLFDKMFQVSFRVPISGYNIQNYIKGKLEHMKIDAVPAEELGFYIELIKHSVGYEPMYIDRLFDSFLLLKKLANDEIYKCQNRRSILFALLCLQTKFHEIYSLILQMKDKMTSDSIQKLCTGQSEVLSCLQLSDNRKTEFNDFSKILYDIIVSDKENGISESEFKAFTEMLNLSVITSK